MMQMADMPTGMMLGMGLMWVLVLAILILGIAAFIKYLRSQRSGGIRISPSARDALSAAFVAPCHKIVRS